MTQKLYDAWLFGEFDRGLRSCTVLSAGVSRKKPRAPRKMCRHCTSQDATEKVFSARVQDVPRWRPKCLKSVLQINDWHDIYRFCSDRSTEAVGDVPARPAREVFVGHFLGHGGLCGPTLPAAEQYRCGEAVARAHAPCAMRHALPAIPSWEPGADADAESRAEVGAQRPQGSPMGTSHCQHLTLPECEIHNLSDRRCEGNEHHVQLRGDDDDLGQRPGWGPATRPDSSRILLSFPFRCEGALHGPLPRAPGGSFCGRGRVETFETRNACESFVRALG